MNYEVGYGKAPKHSRYQPGESGNPKGRPRGSRNLATVIRSALQTKVTVTVDGKRRRVSKFEAACIQQANKAASGDANALRLLVSVLTGAEALEGAARGQETLTPEAKRKIYDDVLRGLADRGVATAADDEDGSDG